MRSLSLSLALLLPLSCLAFDFKGLGIGKPGTPEQVQATIGVKCGIGANNRQVCNGPVTIANERGFINLVINSQGIIQRMALSLQPESFDLVAPLLIEKFGTPAATNRSTVQNRMGATFEQTIHMWHDDSENQVIYQRYSGRLTDSTLSFTTKEDREMLQRLRGDPKKDI